MRLTKDGTDVILVAISGVIIFTLAGFICSAIIAKLLMVSSWIFLLFTFYFFRDPERIIPPDENAIVSAADGKVVEIKEIVENQYLQSNAKQISVFMSIFNVHVNRIPMSGQVGFFEYRPGKFVKAYKNAASKENEQTVIGIENPHCKILIKQIAGILARRIVCHLREGFHVQRGERFGMIKFGSRVDMILPSSAKITVQLNQKVKGGETIIAKIQN
ncbi:phosphatidylserine decarboxylase family protein [candidate division KSB1 bacterium]|nr:MAG: phosphatidylserine decarboxylase family protein [candidate division KSB1 bacterium]